MDRRGRIGWYSRGYLPHFDGGAISQFITFRLADSLPKGLIEGWTLELACLGEQEAKDKLRRRIEGYLDQGHGKAWLRDARIARIVEDVLLYFDGQRYRMHAWVVMPNHVHVLATPVEGWYLRVIIGGWKSFSARQANAVSGRKGKFWQEDYFDRYIRDGDHFARARRYIEGNPVKAGLCAKPEEWEFGSARRRAGNREA